MDTSGTQGPSWLGARLPRYTSYPTAPHFGPLGHQTYGAWLDMVAPPQRGSLYVHIPFCRALCWFCGCHMQVANRYERVAAYLADLEREIALVGQHLDWRVKMEFLHFGGGSPTLLEAEDFTRLMAALRRAFSFTGKPEIALEVDPRTIDDDKIAAYARAGVSRVSLGVQDFESRVQEAIARVQPLELVEGVIDRLRRAGIGQINFDLIYGLPHQSLASVKRTARRVTRLSPARIALFGYAHVPWMQKHQKMIDEAALPGDTERLDMFDAMARIFEAAGYVPVGMDHFAHPDDELAEAARRGALRRNFQGYTTDDAELLLGLGASAIGRLPRGYVQNTPDLRAYRGALRAGSFATVRGRPFGENDRLFGEVIEQLMANLAVDLAVVAAKYRRPLAVFEAALSRLAPLEAEGVAAREGSMVRLSSPHRSAIRAVAACFDEYLANSPARHSRVA